MSGAAELSVDRLIRVRDQFVSAPDRLEMDDFVNPVYDERQELCGTTVCIGGAGALDAGFITLRSTPRPGTERVMYDVTPTGEQHKGDSGTWEMFMAALGLSHDQANRLFFLSGWPKGFRSQFVNAKDAASRARVTARRIDQFIATGGRE